MAAATGAPLGGVNPRPKPKPNPSADCPGPRSGGKPVALADITNTGRPGPPRHTITDVLKENAKLAQLLAQKNKIIERSVMEITKLRNALQSTHQQNVHFAQTQSQITAELNQAKDRLRLLQHELACATAVLKVKASAPERKSSTADNQLRTEIASQEELKAAPSEFAPIEAHQADNKDTRANVHHSVKTQSSLPFNTDRPDAPPDETNKRASVNNTRTSKRKSESCEGTKETNTFQQSQKPDGQPTGSSHHEGQRNTVRRRSARLSQGPCAMAEASCETLHTDTAVPSSCSFSVPELDEPNIGEDMATQDDLLCNTAVHIKASVLPKNEINKHLQKEANVQEGMQEAHSGITSSEEPEAHQIDNRAKNTNPIHSAETQPSLPFNTQQPEPPKERATKRGGRKRKLDFIEDTNGKLDSTCSEPSCLEETRNSPKRKTSRKNPGESREATKGTLETEQEATIAPFAPSSSDALMEQSKDEKQIDSRSSVEPSEEQAMRRSSVQVTGRRSSVRAAAKAVSYKEPPLNVKMRRP